ncbi:hypothetical protein LCM10_04755 [Rossellomorea aquimaris]|uniref:hypothetical protein n=1 Tax=Rossellomorea aquimaris TaxID=189382 RepID=UPI001CD4FB70|nr:hypothetical protein [Rossellomorea aquimaris]MCA1054289.1 hypothetical protein [Rossellomorea aquimaris]
MGTGSEAGRGDRFIVPVWSGARCGDRNVDPVGVVYFYKKDGEMMGMFMTKAAVEAGDSFLEEGRKMYRLLIDLMGAADVREDGLGFLSYGEIWRACCVRGMFLLHKEGFAVMDGLTWMEEEGILRRERVTGGSWFYVK